MANDFEVGVDMAIPADEAWVLVGDPARIGEWFSPVVSCEMKGEERRTTMGSGAVLVERIVDHDDAARSYSYTVVSGIPGLTSHRATVRVDEAPGGCRVLWRQTATSEIEGYDIEARLAAVMTAGLESLRDTLEGAGGGA
jgi:polyketide cyclase/dehydrase/lipid transport protein